MLDKFMLLMFSLNSWLTAVRCSPDAGCERVGAAMSCFILFEFQCSG